MATIKERRAKAARKRIDKGKKPFTDTKPTPRRKTLPKKGVVKVKQQRSRRSFPVPGTAAHDEIVRKQIERANENLARLQARGESIFERMIAGMKRTEKANTEKVRDL